MIDELGFEKTTNEAGVIGLKPCPFCGTKGPVLIRKWFGFDNTLFCTGCTCQLFALTPHRVFAKWNTREGKGE